MNNIEAEQGFLIVASNNSEVDYIYCAKVLAKSIKLNMPQAKICLLTDKQIDISKTSFDYCRTFPYGDVSKTDWKLDNDWQVFWASPFRETIKLEADMIVTGDISHWWDMLRHNDVVVSTKIYDYKGNINKSRHYRKVFDLNNLPDTYNAITYWRLSKTAQEFFTKVRHIFENWNDYKTLLVGANEEIATTDLVYAIACSIIGIEKTTLPGSYPSFVHMKSKVNNITSEDWRKQIVWELSKNDFRLNTVTQTMPLHYHIKEFAYDIDSEYERIN